MIIFLSQSSDFTKSVRVKFKEAKVLKIVQKYYFVTSKTTSLQLKVLEELLEYCNALLSLRHFATLLDMLPDWPHTPRNSEIICYLTPTFARKCGALQHNSLEVFSLP